MATAIARFLRLLSANRITTATSNPPKANMHTTAHVPGQNPCSHPLRITLPQSRWYTARNWMKEAQKTREGGREGGRERGNQRVRRERRAEACHLPARDKP